jgi:hypothetical protein
VTGDDRWRTKSDGELLDAARHSDDYSALASQAIFDEIARRRDAGEWTGPAVIHTHHADAETVRHQLEVAAVEAGFHLDPEADADRISKVIAREEAKKGNLLVRLWRGDVALRITYWVAGVIGGLLGTILASLAILSGSLILQLSAFVLLAGHYIFMLIAIWRSAGKYTGNKIWAHLARLSLVIGFLRAFISLLNS